MKYLCQRRSHHVYDRKFVPMISLDARCMNCAAPAIFRIKRS